MLLLAFVFQGPGRAIGQLLDLPGHARLLGAAMDRVRRSGRLLAVAVGVSVVAWTATQTFSYSVASGRDDELLLTKGRRLSDVALNQGYLAALTPLRDVVGLGLMIPLLIAASVVLFQFSTDRWGTGIRPPASIRRRSSRWATIGWGSTALYALYRFVGLVTGYADLPLGGCVFLEAVVVPMFMALADGVVVAWVLVELRNAGLGDLDRDSLDVVGVSVLIPAAILACVLAFPSRYVATGVWLAAPVPSVELYLGDVDRVVYFGWQLGWGLVYLQGAAVLAAGLFGAVAWSRGMPGDVLKGYRRLLSAEGGHLVAAVAASGLAAGGLSAVAYMLVLSLPALDLGLECGRLLRPLREPADRPGPDGRPDRARRAIAADGDPGQGRLDRWGGMSFEVYLQCFEGGEPAGISRAAVRALFPVIVADSEPDYWIVRYDELNSCDIHVAPLASDGDLIESLCVNHPCGDPRLWDSLWKVMRMGPPLCFISPRPARPW